MFPSKMEPGYGSFIKNICSELANFEFHQKYNALIIGKADGFLRKLKKYYYFYLEICKSYFKKYDFIYLHFPNQAIPILLILSIIKKKKIIINFHGEDLMYSYSGYGYFLGKMMEYFCRKNVIAIVVPSEYFKQEVIKRSIIKPNRIIISPSGGINKDYFYMSDGKVRNSINKEKLRIKLGYVGRLEDGKGYLEFLQVCKFLKFNEPDILFNGIIIGYGSKREDVDNFINTNQLSDDITIISSLPQSEIGSYYRDLDLLIFSSSRSAESLGLTGIEAMACGIPVIGSDVGGIKSYLIDGYNGWMIPQHNIDAIVKCIKKYISLSIYEKNTLSKNCKKTGQLFYSNRVGKMLAEEFLKVLI